MAENVVNAQLSVADRQAVLAAITTIKEKLPFLTDISPEERRTLPKMGDKSRAFVSKALELATQNQGILPRSFDLEAMQRDVELTEGLYPILLALTQLLELVEDTYVIAGSEAYTAALLVYSYAKASGKEAGLDEAIDNLGRRFARKTRPNGQTINPATSN